jgi:hypothetical protein
LESPGQLGAYSQDYVHRGEQEEETPGFRAAREELEEYDKSLTE